MCGLRVFCPRVTSPHQPFVTIRRHFQYPGVDQWGVSTHHIHFQGAKALYGHIGGTVVDLPLGDVACSGGIQLGQGAVVPEVVDFLPVKVFLVPVEAHWEKEILEDLFD